MNIKKGCACEVREEGGFKDWSDYGKFKEKIDSMDCFEAVQIERQAIRDLNRWYCSWAKCYRCKQCGFIWCLDEPDPPLVGSWGRVYLKSKFDFVPICHFSSYKEYERTRILIEQKIKDGIAREVDGEKFYGKNRQRWIENLKTEEVWRLVEPNDDFPGYWGD